MAYQHFYTRVPAKVSMFNRSDSSDTFACSQGLTRECIEGDISSVYNTKPNKDEIALIRENRLPPVYFHYTGKSGNWILSCMSFLPLDYTGERPGYLVHSLVMTEEEKQKYLFGNGSAVLNPDFFVKDLSGFDLTSFESHPNDAYPEAVYTPASASSPSVLRSKFDPDMLKRMIFAMLSICCGKGKSVYFSLTDKLETASVENLAFFNTILQIFPYHLRENLPFASYTPDALKYSDFRIKGITGQSAEIPSIKGITLHFGSRISLGLQDDAVRAEKFTVEFFFDLLTNEERRLEFLRFVDHIVRKSGNTRTTLKTLREIVLLFCQCSGMYLESDILPNDDSVYEFVSIYEKYRFYLEDEYRSTVLRCLKRFPESQKPIPPKTFSKLQKIYSDETPASRHLVMDIALSLIHTDAMRPKLFSFITSNFAEEDAEMKTKIVGDLSRVYYGGFLRAQILEFFSSVYGEMEESCRDEIFEKLLLTIRTDAISEQILEFLNRNFESFNEQQKKKLYTTYFEVLSDSSDLSASCSELINSLLPKENETQKAEFEEEFCRVIEKDQRKAEHKCTDLILSGDYPVLAEILARRIFGSWSKRVIFVEYVSHLWNGNLSEGIEATAGILNTYPDMSEETAEKLLAETAIGFAACAKSASLSGLIEAEKLIAEKSEEKYASFWDRLTGETLHPAICAASENVLSSDASIVLFEAYAAEHPYVTESVGYEKLERFRAVRKAAEENNVTAFLEACKKVDDRNELRMILKVIKAKQKVAMSPETVSLWAVISMAEAQNAGKGFDFGRVSEDIGQATEEKISDAFEWECNTVLVLLQSVDIALPYLRPDFTDKLLTDGSLSEMLSGFVSRQKKPAEKWLKTEVKGSFASFSEPLRSALNTEIKRFGGNTFLAKLFKK